MLQVTVWAAAAALVGWAVVLGRGARGRAWPWALAAVLVVGAAALVVFTPYVIRACPAVLAALLAQPAWAHAAPRTRRSASGDIRPFGPAAGATDGVLRAFVLSDNAPHSGGTWRRSDQAGARPRNPRRCR